VRLVGYLKRNLLRRTVAWRKISAETIAFSGNFYFIFFFFSSSSSFFFVVVVFFFFFFFFFFFRRYNFNSLKVLAFSTCNFQFLRTWMQPVQFFIFSFFLSFLMSSSHLFFGLPKKYFIYNIFLNLTALYTYIHTSNSYPFVKISVWLITLLSVQWIDKCNSPGVAQRVPGGLGSQISMT
jgi:hypothetical protein